MKITLCAILLVSILFRLIDLGSLPGINADETWFADQALSFVRGEAFISHTPSGRLSSPLYNFFLVPLHVVFEPSFALVRMPAVLSGLLLIFFTFWMCRKVFDLEVAITAALVMALLPINIAYSRFGWASSQSPLVCAIALYVSWRGNFLLMAIAFVACLYTHATNAFILPGMIFLSSISIYNKTRNWKVALPVFISCAAVGKLLIDLCVPAKAPSIGSLFHHFFHMKTWSSTIPLWGELLNGNTIYRYILGEITPLTASIHNIVFWTFAIIAIGYGGFKIISFKKQKEMAFFVAALSTFVLFAVGAGPQSMVPNVERWSMVLIAPSVLCLAIGYKEFLKSHRKVAIALGLCFALAALASFGSQYFHRLKTYGSKVFVFKVGSPEPKIQALNWIRGDAHQKEVTVVTEDFWLYWPMKYLLHDDPHIKLLLIEPAEEKLAEIRNLYEAGAYLVGFSRHVFHRQLKQENLKHVVHDNIGVATISIWKKDPI